MHIVFTRSSTIYDDSRATKEITTLLEAGHLITVLGWDRNGSASEKCADLFSVYKDRVKFNFYSGDTGVGSIQKILGRFSWNRWLKKELSKELKIDVIHACDYDTGAAVRRFAKSKKIKYVYDIYDYYVDAHPIPSILRKIIENDEIRTIDNSEVTIICTEERRVQISKAHPKRVSVIHNSPEVEEYVEYDEKYDYVYCGSLYGGRLIKEVLDMYPENHEYKFIVAGYGEYEKKAKELATVFDEFTYLGSIPYSKVLEVEKISKVISAIYEPSIRNHQLCAPNKFYEALALGKPVIVCRGTGIDKIVEEHNIGIVIDYDANQFYEALCKLCSDDQERSRIGRKSRKIYEEKYHWRIMKNRLLSVYQEIIGNSMEN